MATRSMPTPWWRPVSMAIRSLVPTPSLAATSTGSLKPQALRSNSPPKPPSAESAPFAAGGLRQRLDRLHQGVAGRDIHAGIGVAHAFSCCLFRFAHAASLPQFSGGRCSMAASLARSALRIKCWRRRRGRVWTAWDRHIDRISHLEEPCRRSGSRRGPGAACGSCARQRPPAPSKPASSRCRASTWT